MTKSQRYFEQVPLETVRKVVEESPEKPRIVPYSSRRPRYSVHCSVCGKPLAVETAKTDGNGQAVHEECYLASIRSQKEL